MDRLNSDGYIDRISNSMELAESSKQTFSAKWFTSGMHQLTIWIPMSALYDLPEHIIKVKVKVWFYIALYPVHWTAQSALHFPPLADLFIPTPLSASLGSILVMQQLRNDYSLTFPPLYIARYSFIQLS